MVFAPWYMDLDIRFRRAVEGAVDPLTRQFDVITSKKSSEWGNNFIHDANIKRFGFYGVGGDTVPLLHLILLLFQASLVQLTIILIRPKIQTTGRNVLT